MHFLQFLFLNLILFCSALFSAEKVAFEAAKLALKPLISFVKDGSQSSRTAVDFTYKAVFIHELSHMITALSFGNEVKSLAVGPRDGYNERRPCNPTYKDSLIMMAGPLGELIYLKSKSPIFNKNKHVPYLIYSYSVLTASWSLVPWFGNDGYHIASNMQNISYQDRFDDALKRKQPYAHIAAPMMMASSAAFFVSLYKAKKQGYIIGKTGLPTFLALSLFGPKFEINNFDDSWNFNLKK